MLNLAQRTIKFFEAAVCQGIVFDIISTFTYVNEEQKMLCCWVLSA